MSETEIRKALKERADTMTARVIFRPVGSNQAVVEIERRRFTIDNSRRLVDAGLHLDTSARRTTLKGKTQRDVNEFFNQYPKLTAADFK